MHVVASSQECNFLLAIRSFVVNLGLSPEVDLVSDTRTPDRRKCLLSTV
jgi:hypothetical protein